MEFAGSQVCLRQGVHHLLVHERVRRRGALPGRSAKLLPLSLDTFSNFLTVRFGFAFIKSIGFLNNGDSELFPPANIDAKCPDV